MTRTVVGLLALVVLLPGVGAQAFPEPRGHVNDFANAVDDAAEAALETRLRAFANATGHEVAVATVDSLGGKTVEDYAREMGNQWGVGKQGQDNGVLVLLAMQERELRIAVGDGLRANLTDAEAVRIVENVMVPELRAGRTTEAVVQGVGAVLAEAEAAPQPPPDFGPFLRGAMWVVGGLVALVVVVKSVSAAFARHERARREHDEARALATEAQERVSDLARAWPRVQDDLRELQAYDRSVWHDVHARVATVPLEGFKRDAPTVVALARKRRDRHEARAAAQGLLRLVQHAEAAVAAVRARRALVVDEQNKLRTLAQGLEERLRNARALVVHPDAASRDLVPAFEDAQRDLRALVERVQGAPPRTVRWLDVAKEREDAVRALRRVEASASDAIAYAQRARTEGPALLRKVEEDVAKLDALEKAAKSARAKEHIRKAREEYRRVEDARRDDALDWVFLYAVLMSTQSSCASAHAAEASHGGSFGGGRSGGAGRGGSFESSRSRDDDGYSSSSSSSDYGGGFGGFGGGSFGGGGGSGKW